MEMPLTRRSVLMPTYRFFYRVNSHCQYYSLNTKILPGYLVSATCFQLQKDTWYIVKNNNLLHIIWRKSHILYGSMKVVLRFFPLLKLGRHKRPTGTRYTLAWNENRPTRRNKHRKRESLNMENWWWRGKMCKVCVYNNSRYFIAYLLFKRPNFARARKIARS